MKTLLILILSAAALFFVAKNHEAQLALDAAREREAQAQHERKMQQLQEALSKAQAERGQAARENEAARAALQQARSAVTTAQAELDRLRGIVPRDPHWIEKRLSETSGKLDAPPIRNAARVRTYPRYYYYPYSYR